MGAEKRMSDDIIEAKLNHAEDLIAAAERVEALENEVAELEREVELLRSMTDNMRADIKRQLEVSHSHDQKAVKAGISERKAVERAEAAEARAERLAGALREIAKGEGVYGAQAHEYKQIARAALASEPDSAQPKNIELKPGWLKEDLEHARKRSEELWPTPAHAGRPDSAVREAERRVIDDALHAAEVHEGAVTSGTEKEAALRSLFNYVRALAAARKEG